MADRVVRRGHAAIVDAVFARSADREAIQHSAFAAGVSFAGLWLDAPEPVRIARVARRRLDASDADAAVIRRQLDQPTGAIHWQRLDASLGAEPVLKAAMAVVGERQPGRLTHVVPSTTTC